MASKLRWGILGTGNIARQFSTGVNVSRRGTLTAVGSRNAGSAQEFAQSFHIPAAHGSYESLIADPNIDAIYNSLPNSLHCQWSVSAMQAGKHVLCEKPLAMNADEARIMIEASRATGRILMEAFMYRCHPQTLAVIEAVKSGAIGDLRLIRASFCYRTHKIDGNVRFVRELGGGGLMDIGCYCIDFVRLFAGVEPTSVHAAANIHATGVDDWAAGTLHFPNHILGSFTCGMSLQADNTAHLCGSDGYIEIPVPWKPPSHQAKFVITRGSPPRMDATDKAPAAPAPPPRDVRFVDSRADLYAVEADDFAATLIDSAPPRISLEHSLGNMKVLDEMRNQIGLEF